MEEFENVKRAIAGDEESFLDGNFSFTTYKIEDANGKLIRSPSSSMQYDSGKMESHLVLDLEPTDYKNPIHLEIDAYPNYIEFNVKIELKNPIK